MILINGRDVSKMAHDQVVAFIRAARGALGGELLLTIKPNGEYSPLFILTI